MIRCLLLLQVAAALLAEVCSAYEHVLLDGGPTRVFIPADVDLINADLAQVKNLFYADGDGISRQVRWQANSSRSAGLYLCAPFCELIPLGPCLLSVVKACTQGKPCGHNKLTQPHQNTHFPVMSA